MSEYRELPFIMPSVVRDFISRIQFSSIDECWIFGNCKTRPTFYIDGVGYVATRISYKIFKGVDNPRMMMCHKCDNPPCVNPHHLYPGSARENNDDQIRRNRTPILRAKMFAAKEQR
jgi:hypothetical protein